MEFDTHRNTWERSRNHVELSRFGALVPQSLAVERLPHELRNSGAFDAEVVIDGGDLEVYLSDEQLAMNRTMVLSHRIPGFDQFEGFVGFIGSAGELSDIHTVHSASFQTTTP